MMTNPSSGDALGELHHAIIRTHQRQADARRLPWWFDHAVTYHRLLPLGHYALVVFHLDITLAQRRWIENRWKTAHHGPSAVAVWTPPSSRAQAERDEKRVRQENEAHRLLRRVLLTEPPDPSATDVLALIGEAMVNASELVSKDNLRNYLDRPPRNASTLERSYRASGLRLVRKKVDGKPAGTNASADTSKRRRIQPVEPCVPTADHALRAGNPREFAMLLDTIRANAGITAGRLAAVAAVPRNSVYLMLNPERDVLPTKPDNVRNVAIACGLPPNQVEKVMTIWVTLRNSPGSTNADESVA